MPPQPASKAKIFAFLNFLCSKLRGCGKGNKVATKTKSGNIKALLYSDSIIDLEKKYDYGLNIPTMRLGSGDVSSAFHFGIVLFAAPFSMNIMGIYIIEKSRA